MTYIIFAKVHFEIAFRKRYEIHFDLLLPHKNKIRQFIISLMAPAFYQKMQLTLLND